MVVFHFQFSNNALVDPSAQTGRPRQSKGSKDPRFSDPTQALQGPLVSQAQSRTVTRGPKSRKHHDDFPFPLVEPDPRHGQKHHQHGLGNSSVPDPRSQIPNPKFAAIRVRISTSCTISRRIDSRSRPAICSSLDRATPCSIGLSPDSGPNREAPGGRVACQA